MVNKEADFINKRSKIRNQILDTVGAEPTFYANEDIEGLRAYVKHHMDGVKNAGLKFVEAFDHAYTFHRNVSVMPVPQDFRVRLAERYGFFRMGLLQTHIRPNIKNVVSCHRPYDSCRVPHGQLGYITNPYWACYGIIQDGNSMAKVDTLTGDEFVDRKMLAVASSMPNLVGSVNVMFGTTQEGYAAAYLSRVYGANNAYYPAQRLVEWFANQGYVVVVARAWAKNYGFKVADPVRVTTGLFNPFITCTAYDWNLGNKADNYPAYRHPDIAPPRITRAGMVFEVQDGYRVDLPASEYANAKGASQFYSRPSAADLQVNIEAIGQKVSTQVKNVACEATRATLENNYSRMWEPEAGHYFSEGVDKRHIGKVTIVEGRIWPDEVKPKPTKVVSNNKKKAYVPGAHRLDEVLQNYVELERRERDLLVDARPIGNYGFRAEMFAPANPVPQEVVENVGAPQPINLDMVVRNPARYQRVEQPVPLGVAEGFPYPEYDEDDEDDDL